MQENRIRVIETEEYADGYFAPRLWWDVSIFYLLLWPIAWCWRTFGAGWIGTILVISACVMWVVSDPDAAVESINHAVYQFFTYMAGK